jgi:threonine dehydrogenase-like Zn-dependent dehydrogenase
MKAIRFDATIPKYAAGLALSKVRPALLWSGRSCTSLDDVPLPALPAPDWVRVKTRLGGICGSDLSAIHLHTSPYYSALTSFPYTLGHENVGVISEVGPAVVGWRPGERVVVEPTLWCAPRGFTPADWCPACQRGEINRCQRFQAGRLAPGLFIGSCPDTGGSWSPYFVAHQSQLYRVPEHLSDDNALMTEPFACGLHPAVQHMPPDDATVLIIGGGTIGLCVLAALRGLGSQAAILVAARYPFQREAARRLGASDVLDGDVTAEVVRRTGAALRKPLIGRPVIVGGVDMTFECAGSDRALDDALRLTRSGGKVVLVGVPGIPKDVDWTAIFAQELTVAAAYTFHHAEPWQGQTWRAFDLALDLLGRGVVDLSWLVTHRFPLEQYDEAFTLLARKGSSRCVKAVFQFS